MTEPLPQTPPEGDGKAAVLSWRRLLPLAIVVGFLAFAFAQGWHQYLTLQYIAGVRSDLQAFVGGNFLSALLIYTAIYIAVSAGSLPAGALLTVTGGFLFGPWYGTAATVIGATIGATIIFLAARTALGEPLAKKAGPWLHKVRAGFQEDELNYLLFLRLVPVFPFWFVNLAPAFVGMKLRTYFIGTLIGIIPGSFAFAYVGQGLNSIIVEQEKAYRQCLAERSGEECSFTLDPGALLTTDVLIAFAVLGIVALIPPVAKRWRKKTAGPTGPEARNNE